MRQRTTFVLKNRKEILAMIQKFQENTKRRWYVCVNSSIPEFSMRSVKEGYIAAFERGVKIMYITEITRRNLKYCREIMALAELRHLDGVRGNFALSEREYVAGVMHRTSLTSLVYTNVAELVRQQKQVFETLWNQAIPASKIMNGM